MRKSGLLSILLLIISFFVKSQDLVGKVIGEDDKAISNSTITILKVMDSITPIKYAISDSKGNFIIRNLKPGSYYISVTSSGYQIKNTENFEIGSGKVNLPAIRLSRLIKTIDSVKVTSSRPVFSIKPDRLIMNVESSPIALGSDAMSLISQLPGLSADNNDNLSSLGKSGVRVYIDGKKLQLSGKDLSLHLKSLKSSQIEFIEIITVPSAKYEAEGNAAIVNIRLKRNSALGTNGTANIGYAIATFPKYNFGLNLNHRKRKTNIYGSLNVSRKKDKGYFHFYRELADSIFDQKGNVYGNLFAVNYNAGIEFLLNRRNSLKLNVGGNKTNYDSEKESETPIYFQTFGNKIKNLKADNNNRLRKNNIDFNFNYKYTDSTYREFSIDADLGQYNNRSNQLQPNFYYNSIGNIELYRNVYQVITPIDINLFSLKTDYEQNFKNGKLSWGAYASLVKTKNIFDQYNVIGSSVMLDSIRSNMFNYSEDILATYASYSKSIRNINFYIGLRLENNVAKGRSLGKFFNGTNRVYDSSFQIQYLNLFPNFSLTYKNGNNKYTLSFSQRIDRPSYSDLNPFEYKLDEYTFQRGNSALLPQYTNSIGLNYIYKSSFSASLNYSHVRDVFAFLTDTADISKAFLSKRNIAVQDITSLNLNMPVQAGKYNAFINVNTYYSVYKANFGLDREFNLDVFSVNLNLQQSYKLSKSLSVQLSSWFNSPTIWQGTFKSKSMGAVDVGFQKSILKGNGIIKMAVSDIFKTFKWRSVSDFAGQYFRANSGNESRMFKIDLSYRFGNSSLKTSNQKRNSLEEEKKRVQSSGVL